MANLFDKFLTQTKKVKIKALDNAEIEIRELTVAEGNEFYQKLVKGLKEDGSVELDIQNVMVIRLEKISKAMVEPKMTVDELKALSSKANDAITEISDAIDSFSEKGK